MIWLLVAIVLVLLFLWLKRGSSMTSFSSPDPNDVEESERTKIIEDYGIVMEQLLGKEQLVGKKSFFIYNENNLPSSKSIIKNALLLELRKYPYDFWQENGKEKYEALLDGLFALIWFQPDLSDRELRIPDVDKEDLSKLGNERSMILVIEDSLNNGYIHIVRTMADQMRGYKTTTVSAIAGLFGLRNERVA